MNQAQDLTSMNLVSNEIYGTFNLSGKEYALSVDAVQEVVNAPERFSPVPLSPHYVLGVFDLRGMIIPVVDLCKVLDIEKTDESTNKKVAIIEYGNLCVGILFDSTSEVVNLKNQAIDVKTFEKYVDKSQGLIIEKVFQFRDSERSIQVLNPYELLKLEDLPKTDESVAQKINLKKRGRKEQCISFKVNNSICALNINNLQEIVKVENIQETALSGYHCLGAISIRGVSIPVVNFEDFLGYKSSIDLSIRDFSKYRIIVINIEGEDIGILVDSIDSIQSFFQDEVMEFAALNDTKKGLFRGCLKDDQGKEIVLLDYSYLCSDSALIKLAKGHGRLYNDKSAVEEQNRLVSLKNHSYIVFSVSGQYSFEINDVSEVLDYPEEVLTPPGLDKKFVGVMDVRGDLIPILDPSTIYRFDQDYKTPKNKVLVLNYEGKSLAIIVDSVNSIVAFNENNSQVLPEFVYRGERNSLNDDIKTAYQVKSITEEKDQVYLVMDLGMIFNRIFQK